LFVVCTQRKLVLLDGLFSIGRPSAAQQAEGIRRANFSAVALQEWFQHPGFPRATVSSVIFIFVFVFIQAFFDSQCH